MPLGLIVIVTVIVIVIVSEQRNEIGIGKWKGKEIGKGKGKGTEEKEVSSHLPVWTNRTRPAPGRTMAKRISHRAPNDQPRVRKHQHKPWKDVWVTCSARVNLGNRRVMVAVEVAITLAGRSRLVRKRLCIQV
jgi:hypothetical protein